MQLYKRYPNNIVYLCGFSPYIQRTFLAGQYFTLSICFHVAQSLYWQNQHIAVWCGSFCPNTTEERIWKKKWMFCRVHCKDLWLNYSAAVSSCFKEAGGKLVLFTANIVQRLSHPNKIIEAQGRKKETPKEHQPRSWHFLI